MKREISARRTGPLTGVRDPDDVSTELVAKFFRALGDPTRLSILECLVNGPKTVSELVAALDCQQSRISNHLSCLRSCRFVLSRSEGKWVTYSLADAQLRSLIDLARRLVNKNATYFALCATVGA